METKKGKEETKKILEVRRWNSNIYPNLSFMSQFGQLRVVHPVAVNETVVHTYSFRLCGAPARMFENAISFANIVNGTGSLVLTDDLEIYNRIGLGLVERRPGMDRDRSRLSGRYAATSMAAVAAATPPARSTFVTCSMPGSPSWCRKQNQRAAARKRRAPRRAAAMNVAQKSSEWRDELFKGEQAGPIERSECERFLIHEARLLDEARFDEWLALFAPDAMVLGACGTWAVHLRGIPSR